MKPLRICWYLITAGLFVAGRYTGRREFFLLFFIMLFVVAYSLALTLWTIFSFSYTQEVSQSAAIKGTTPRLRIGIFNDKPFPFTLMRIQVETVTRSEQYQLSFNLSPQSHIDFDIPLHCPYRGLYNVGMTRVEFNDIFGLVRIPFDMRSLSYYRQRLLKIYPRLVTLPYLPAQSFDAKFTPGGMQRVSEEGETFADLRRYRPGDPLKRVHKVASAKKRELYVRNYDIPMETAVLVAVDTAAIPSEGESALYLADLACECAAALSSYALRSDFMVELLEANPRRPILHGRGHGDFNALYDALALMPFDGRGNLPRQIEAATHSRQDIRAVYVITAGESAAFVPILSRLAREGLSVKLLELRESRERAGQSAIPGVGVVRLRVGDELGLVLGGV